jgi:hypothetical protein
MRQTQPAVITIGSGRLRRASSRTTRR